MYNNHLNRRAFWERCCAEVEAVYCNEEVPMVRTNNPRSAQLEYAKDVADRCALIADAKLVEWDKRWGSKKDSPKKTNERQMIEVVSAKWVLLWLKNRDKKNLVLISNPLTLTVGFVERDKSDGVACRISVMVKTPQIYKLYNELKRKEENKILSPMVQNWVSYAISKN